MTYQERVAQQIAQYAQTTNMHDLPEIFHIWSSEFIAPGLMHVFGSDKVIDLFLDACMAARPGNRTLRVLSIGCGDGSIEVDLGKKLVASGVTDFKIVGADLSPILLKQFKQKVADAKLTSNFDVVEEDLNNIKIAGPFDVLMANHSLHHIVELEKLFAYSTRVLTDTGIFAINDMVGRNGHMRWPETAAGMKLFWPLLEPEQRYHAQLQRIEVDFLDHDCSTEGFEGIRAQDILPLLLNHFHPSKFLGVGGFIDLFVDRGYGHGFDVKNEKHVALIRRIAAFNDKLLDAGAIKPTIMLAHFQKHPVEERFYRSRSAQRCVRRA